MYYVNRDQIDLRLRFIPTVAETLRRLKAEWREGDPVQRFALERLVHLAAECVTDVGTYVIDGFLMRDAGSYEDIIDIIHGEKAISDELRPRLAELVGQRKPLVQQYFQMDEERLAPFLDWLPGTLEAFAAEITAYIEKELG